MSSKLKSLVHRLSRIGEISLKVSLLLLALPWYVYALEVTTSEHYKNQDNELEKRLSCAIINWYNEQLRKLFSGGEKVYKKIDNLEKKLNRYKVGSISPLLGKVKEYLGLRRVKEYLSKTFNPPLCRYYQSPKEDKP